ncbi:malate synthase G [Corynebacterium sp. TAE3-ERU12]|uniref:malate synthase G n=1 Tax=Corynebacterium sp. TAE3-ERU12 TaxID=2849491 RepID=UPI001C48884C|nr:malate synthase G [Corynebacterium sp. TAE3-ERU12]MBV7294514.1 malate synthase G [Corynebacterium sp. TAE3-ERU12]
MTERITVGGLQVAKVLYDFVNDTALPAAKITDKDAFWQGFGDIVEKFTPRNEELLAKRDELQAKVDDWYRENPGKQDQDRYVSFLKEIGYLAEDPGDFQVTTANVDEEIAATAGPQLVVPVLNARFAINATNARWGSLYDALYGTNAISEEGGAEKGKGGYNKVRGDRVIAWGRDFLDKALPLADGSHADVENYAIKDGALVATVNGADTKLANPELFVGYTGDKEQPSSFYFKHNGLHIELEIDPEHPIGKTDKAGVKDITLEAAVTNIMDLEDSVAAVDAADKTLGYTNWLGLNVGDLELDITKGGKPAKRVINDDRSYTDLEGNEVKLHGRSMNLVRNVGHLMRNPAILDRNGNEIFEGIMDAVITPICAIPGLDKNNARGNSREGSIYIVKPKQHGPAESAFTSELFADVEDLLGLERNTMKVGLMDEERRTSVNLDACIKEVSERVVFINTGFMDRTGDEIHTSMAAGPMYRKAEQKTAKWMLAYEDNNVDAGLAHGLQGKAQIGKGMWAMTEQMAELLDQKIGQPKQGASTAWVPSPTGAVLHATHYHEVDVFGVQDKLIADGRRDTFGDLLTIPVDPSADWSEEERQNELDNNCQSILGYVIRWVEQGVGCSKVPDINDVALMEDRATLRISSQTLANWIEHDVITVDQVEDALKRMAAVVDRQNEGDKNYLPMCDDFERSIGFQAARELILEGTKQPSGYTEPILHRSRLEFKKREGIDQD